MNESRNGFEKRNVLLKNFDRIEYADLRTTFNIWDKRSSLGSSSKSSNIEPNSPLAKIRKPIFKSRHSANNSHLSPNVKFQDQLKKQIKFVIRNLNNPESKKS